MAATLSASVSASVSATLSATITTKDREIFQRTLSLSPFNSVKKRMMSRDDLKDSYEAFCKHLALMRLHHEELTSRYLAAIGETSPAKTGTSQNSAAVGETLPAPNRTLHFISIEEIEKHYSVAIDETASAAISQHYSATDTLHFISSFKEIEDHYLFITVFEKFFPGTSTPPSKLIPRSRLLWLHRFLLDILTLYFSNFDIVMRVCLFKVDFICRLILFTGPKILVRYKNQPLSKLLTVHPPAFSARLS